MKLFKMGKNVRIGILIWHMINIMVKKQCRARFYLSCNYFCILLYYFLGKMLKNLHTSGCLNLNYGTTKQKPKMLRLQRWWNLSKLVTNTLASLTFIILSAP